ncbi:hypothetical protein L6452_18000 [Arctium lappa]|uniref:Uncharacterized protein n=1 Tax=Arctium lappa TaxID=4217 RepID=A0ACB9C4Y3_ARCLA|nr:hypothetical protein L6452_18000 [Arctium lappa]
MYVCMYPMRHPDELFYIIIRINTSLYRLVNFFFPCLSKSCLASYDFGCFDVNLDQKVCIESKSSEDTASHKLTKICKPIETLTRSE